jgi:hypothetical protein
VATVLAGKRSSGRDLMSHPTTKFRLWGIPPLLFFLAHAFYYWRRGESGHILWMCNVGNLLLAIGLLLDRPTLTRVSAVWLIPGLGLWFWFVVRQWGILFTSTLAHVGGLAVGMVALSRVRVDGRTWLYAFAWYLFMQQVCRLVTAAELNVNVAHRVYEGWEATFSAYWQFWLATTLVVAACLWIIVTIFSKLWPPRSPSGAPAHR